MSFVFNDDKGLGLRLKFKRRTAAEMNPTSGGGAAGALELMVLTQPTKILLFENRMNVDVNIYLCHPNNDPDVVGNRLKAFTIPGQTPLNFDVSGSLGLSFEPGLYIYAGVDSGTASSTSALSVLAWG